MRISEYFKIKKGDIITFTGGGGKTSLIYNLAYELSIDSKVLVTTTTKMYIPEKEVYQELILQESLEKKNTVSEMRKGKGKNIFFLGKNIDLIERKIIGVNSEDIIMYKEKYDYILIEGDGSKGKPVKYWNDKEPVISSCSTKVIGVTNLDAYEKKIEECVHRSTEFCEKFGMKKESIMDVNLFKNYILRNDMFKGASEETEKILFINGVDDYNKLNLALKIFNGTIDRLGDKGIVLGSNRKKEYLKYKKITAILLASGYSERFGKEDKLLFRYKGKTLLERVIKTMKEVEFYKEKIVIREDKKNLSYIKKIENINQYEILINKNARVGISTSIKLGISKIKDEEIMFLTGDQPYLEKETILKLIKYHLMRNGVTIPFVGKEGFSPRIFPNSYTEKLKTLVNDCGGSTIIDYTKDVNKVYFNNNKNFLDIDTKEDIERI